MSDAAPRPTGTSAVADTRTDLSTKVSDAMAHRGLRSVAAEHAAIVYMLRDTGASDEDIEYRLAGHRAKIAWAEVEYAARRAANCVATVYPPPPPAMMTALLSAAYAADEAHLQARRAKADAEYRDRYRMARR